MLYKFSALIIIFGMTLFSGSAFAGPTLCSESTPVTSNSDGLSTSDVKFNGTDSNDCYGVLSGNPSVSDVNGAWGSLYGGGDFSSLVKTEGSFEMESYAGIDFKLAADTTSNDSIFVLFWNCNGNCPVTLDVVFGTKASTSSALYLFDDLLFDNNFYGDTGLGIGQFEISFTNGGGNLPALSNLTMFVRGGDATVSEPGTLSLLGLGLIGLAWRKRQRRN